MSGTMSSRMAKTVHTTNCFDTFIQVAPDCPATEAVVPISKREPKSFPQIEYELLASSPYKFTQ